VSTFGDGDGATRVERYEFDSLDELTSGPEAADSARPERSLPHPLATGSVFTPVALAVTGFVLALLTWLPLEGASIYVQAHLFALGDAPAVLAFGHAGLAAVALAAALLALRGPRALADDDRRWPRDLARAALLIAGLGLAAHLALGWHVLTLHRPLEPPTFG
jgi:hypothetical protein